MVLNKDFKEFIELLNQNKVKYIIIGGYALAFHGHPRYTKDLDIWIYADEKNSKKLIHCLDEFGFSVPELKSSDLLVKDQVIQLGYPPTRIDLLTSASGIDFNDCYHSKILIEIDGLSINFIDIDNLIKNKKATGRLQDLADIEKLS